MKRSASFTFIVKLLAVVMIATTLLAAFPVVNVSAANVVITLDPGHGGSDPGNTSATAFGGNYESVDNWEITKYAKERLQQYAGVTVYLTRASLDTTMKSLADRVAVAKSYNSDAIISIHTNSAAASATGIEALVPNQNWRPAIGTASKACANSILSKFVAATGIKNRGLTEKNSTSSTYSDGSAADYYGIISNGKKQNIPVTMIIETCFASNQGDYNAVLATDATRQRAGYAIADGIAAYYGLSLGSGSTPSTPTTTSTATLVASNLDAHTIDGVDRTEDISITAGQTVGLRGWAGYSIAISQYGYYFDGNASAAVWTTDPGDTTEDAVIGVGGANAKRFHIRANTASLSAGAHTITYVLKLSDGSVQTVGNLTPTVTAASSGGSSSGGSSSGSTAVSSTPVSAGAVGGYVNSLVDYHTINGYYPGPGGTWPDGQGVILSQINDAPVGTLVGIRGWAGFSQNITAAGYYFDSNSASISWTGSVLSLNSADPGDQGVINAAGSLAKRYEIVADTAGLTSGNHTVHFVLKLADGTVAITNSLALNGMTGGASSGGSSSGGSSSGGSTSTAITEVNKSVDNVTTQVNGGAIGQYGKITSVNDFNAAVTTIGLQGWVGYSTAVSAFGYYFDGNTSSGNFSSSYISAFHNSSDQSGILAAGGANAVRFDIQAPMASLSAGNHTMTFAAKFADGTIKPIYELTLGNVSNSAGSSGGSSSGGSSSGGSSSGGSTTTAITEVNKSVDNVTTQVNGGAVYPYGQITAVNDFNAAITTIGLQGWAGYSAAVSAFGYYFDGNTSSGSFSSSYIAAYHSTDDQAAIQAAGGANAVRFDIQAPMSSLTAGNHTVTFAAKFADGTIKPIYELTLGNVTNTGGSSSGGSSSGDNTGSGNSGSTTPSTGTVVDPSAVSGSIVQNDFYTTNTVNQFSYSQYVEFWKESDNIVGITTGDTAGLKGWASFGSNTISQFGYYWDNDTLNITYNIGFAEETGSDVIGAGGANAKRFHIIASGNTAPSSGQHTLYFVAQLSNGTVVRLGYWILNINGTPTGGNSSGSGSGSGSGSTTPSTIPEIGSLGASFSNDYYTTNTVNQFSYSQYVEYWKENIVDITTGDTAGLRGWVGYGSNVISQFGYYWDDQTTNITYNIGFTEETDSNVTAAGGANAKRFHIIASGNTAPSSGQHTLHFVVKFANGTVAHLGYWILEIKGTPTGGSSSGSGSGSGSTDSGSQGSGDPTFDLQYPALSEDMQPIFAGNNGIVWEETVLFIDGLSTTKTLLYPIAEVLEVKFIDPTTGAITYYQEGTHFTVSNGKISMISGSGIKCMPAATWNNWSASPGGSLGNLAGDKYWGENDAMTKWQVRITYKTNSTWSGTEQTTYSDKYASFLSKLKNGQNVTMIFYGDSITYGANASFTIGTKPSDGYSYSMLFTMALADLYDYKINFVASPNGTPLPGTYTPATGGHAGTITYINSAVGGWTSANASTNYNTYVKNYANTYGCDFFSYAFGMNDGGMTAAQTASYANGIIADIKASFPGAAVAIISTMIPNPSSTVNIDYNGQKAQLAAIANNYSNTALVDVTSISLDVYNAKGQLFADYSGNNVNHPNDFLHRVYAQTLFEAVVGYENLSGGSSSGGSSSGGSTSTTVTEVNKAVDNVTTQVGGGPVFPQGRIPSVNDFEATNTVIGLQGWVGYSAAITEFGYYFDGNPSSGNFSSSYIAAFHNADDKTAIQTAGGANAVRFDIQAPMSSLSTGNHTVTFAAKFADGTIKTIYEITLGNVTNSGGTPSQPEDTTEPEDTTTPQPDTPDEPEHVCNFGAWSESQPATCTEGGVSIRTCTCGNSETKAIPATGHTEGTWIVDSEAQPGVNGSKHIECTVCHTTLKTEIIPALPIETEPDHTCSFGAWKETKPATCTEGGVSTRTCTCGNFETKVIPAEGHTTSAWIVDSAAQPGVSGSKHIECTKCHTTLRTEIIPALPVVTEPDDTTVTEPDDTTVTEPDDTTVTEPDDTTVTEPDDTTVTEPDDTTVTEPDDTTVTEPEDTTVEPEDTTVELEDTTVEPEVTTTEPEQSSDDPEDTTAEPDEETTTPNKPSTGKKDKKLSTGAIVGIVIGAIVAAGGIGFAVYWFVFRKKKMI